MSSTASLAAQAVTTFKDWINERDRANDWSDYVRAGKINRSEVAKECGFGRSAWGQNPALGEALSELEKRLVQTGVLNNADATLASLPQEVQAEINAHDERARRAMASKGSLEKRVKTLEEQNAVLRATVRDLNERLRRSAFAEQHLAETGRLLPV